MSPTVSIDGPRVLVATSEGDAAAYVFEPRSRARATVILGHGAGGGVAAWDLQLLAKCLPASGYRVVLVEQPWRLAGRKVAVAPPKLDRAWLDVVGFLRVQAVIDGPLVLGGRSAGARVACRTAVELKAEGVIALAFPLHPPGRPERSRADEIPAALPTLVVQGSRDAFGGAADVAALRTGVTVVNVPGADHGLAVARSALITQAEAGELIIQACLGWLPGAAFRESPRRESL